jgi:curved DNA-binding protein CbpA
MARVSKESESTGGAWGRSFRASRMPDAKSLVSSVSSVVSVSMERRAVSVPRRPLNGSTKCTSIHRRRKYTLAKNTPAEAPATSAIILKVEARRGLRGLSGVQARGSNSAHYTLRAYTYNNMGKEKRLMEDPDEVLEREKEAVLCLRMLLVAHPSIRKDIREVSLHFSGSNHEQVHGGSTHHACSSQMLWNIDQGKLANIKGIPEEDKLKSSIKKLLKLLDLERGDDRDTFRLSPKSSPTLQVLGFVFEDPVETTREIVNQHKEAEARRKAQQEAARQSKESKRAVECAAEPKGGNTEDPPPEATIAAAPPLSRRLMGPEMPSSAMLAAAAASLNDLPSDYDDEEAEDDGGSFIVGPPPPELVKETDAAPQDEREAEVFRIMKVPKSQSQSQQLDAYAILGVDSSAATGEVKKRYMRLSLLIHPDKCSHKDAHEAFQLVSKAAKLLQDSGARKALDEHLEDVELRKLAEEEALKMEKERQWNVALGKESSNAPGPSSGPLPIRREQWMTELPPERKAPSREQQLAARNFSRTGIQERGDTTLWTDAPEGGGGGRDRERGPMAHAGSHMLLGPSSGIGPSMPTSATARAVEAFNSQYRKKTLMEEHLERLAAEKKGGPIVKGQRADDTKGGKEERKRSRDQSESSGESSDESSSSSERERHRKSKHKKDKSKKSKKEKSKKSHKSKDKRRDESWKQKLPAPPPPASKARETEWEAEGHPWQPWDRDKDLERKPMVNPGKVLAADAASRFATSSKTFL